MADDPLYPRIIKRVELGTITNFEPISILDVPVGMLHKLGADLAISPKDMMVEQTVDKDIIVYYNRTESDTEYGLRVSVLKANAVVAAREAAEAKEVAVSWQKFLQLAERFKDRILVLTISPEFE